MEELPTGGAVTCDRMFEALEDLPVDAAGSTTAKELLRQLPESARGHAAGCEACRAALEDFVETRRALLPMRERLPQAGPWFTQKVMRAITAEETELEERENGFRTSVRRLAPRLVAFATLLLMLGGTWAFQEQRSSKPKQEMRGAEGILESVPNVPANDDVLPSMEQMP